MVLRPVVLASILSLALATSTYLTGYSTTTHFACQGVSCATHTNTLSSTTLSALLSHLSTTSTAVTADLPINPDVPAHPARLTLVVRSANPAPADLTLAALKESMGEGGSSFIARAEGLHFAEDVRQVADIEALDVKEGVATVTVGAAEVPRMLAALRVLASKIDSGLAVVWAARDAALNAPDGAVGDAASEAGAKDGEEGVDAGKPVEGDVVADGAPEVEPKVDPENMMYPPEISEAGVAGLLVAFVFLLIFVPGFMCLWNIQPPQSFEIMDSNDVKKKMQ